MSFVHFQKIRSRRFKSRSIPAGIAFLFAVALVCLDPGSCLQAASSVDDTVEPEHRGFLERLREGEKGYFGTHYYWYNGLQIVSPEKNVRLRVRAQLMYDVGYIFAKDDLKNDVSNTDEFQSDFRRLEVWGWGTFYDSIEFKIAFDIANVRELRDNWIRFRKIKHLRQCLIGHVREPFSLENITSTNLVTFMEKALPASALGLGRNMGILYTNPSLDERRTFAMGFFYNTESLSDLENPKDSISDANGYNITGRITGLPRYEDFGERLLHLGLSVSYGSRDDDIRLSSRPESYLVDKALIDTGEFSVDRFYNIAAEVASVSGPFSFQGEYFHGFTDSDAEGDPDFWGYYLYASYFLTGEHREYDTSRGVFTGARPNSYFRFREKGWGAWELALRHSYVDLNDKNISGGKEINFTLGLNWYFTSKTRIMFNYVHARIDHRDPNPLESGYLNILMTRFRILF